MASTEKIVESACGTFQLFKVRGKIVQEKFHGELPGSSITKGLDILKGLDASPTLHTSLLE